MVKPSFRCSRVSCSRVIAIEALKIASTSPARSLVPIGNEGILFLASSVADSMLLHVAVPPPPVCKIVLLLSKYKVCIHFMKAPIGNEGILFLASSVADSVLLHVAVSPPPV